MEIPKDYLLIRANVSSQRDQHRLIKGMKKSGNGCETCSYNKEKKNVKISKKNLVKKNETRL